MGFGVASYREDVELLAERDVDGLEEPRLRQVRLDLLRLIRI